MVPIPKTAIREHQDEESIVIPAHVPLLEENLYDTDSELLQVIPGIFLATHNAIDNISKLQENDISNIILVCNNDELPYIQQWAHIKYCVIEMPNIEAFSAIPCFRQILNFTQKCKGCIVFSSKLAVSRAPALLMSYLMAKYDLNYRQSFHIVKNRRPCINPNAGLRAQLFEYEPILRATQHSQNGGHSFCGQTRRAANKRSPSPINRNHNDYGNGARMYDSTMLPNVRSNNVLSNHQMNRYIDRQDSMEVFDDDYSVELMEGKLKRSQYDNIVNNKLINSQKQIVSEIQCYRANDITNKNILNSSETMDIF